MSQDRLSSAQQNSIEHELRALLSDSLSLGIRGDLIQADTALLGNIPELDSMAVITLLTAIEDKYGFIIDEDDVSAATFETLQTLTDFVALKLEQSL